MKVKTLTLALISVLSFSASAKSVSMMKLLCAPADLETAAFKCLTVEANLRMEHAQSNEKFEFIPNSGSRILTSAIVTQDEQGLATISLTARGLSGQIDLTKSKKVEGGRLVPAILNVFNARIAFNGNLICQGSVGASVDLKKACGIQ